MFGVSSNACRYLWAVSFGTYVMLEYRFVRTVVVIFIDGYQAFSENDNMRAYVYERF